VLVAFAAHAPPPAAAAAQACLEELPAAIAGLPPARPPGPGVIFVYRSPTSRLVLRTQAQIAAWRGRGEAYEGATLSFFETPSAARSFIEASFSGTRVGTVVVQWDRASQAWRRIVERCLASPRRAPPPRRQVPPATLATFVGAWGGHTRGLRIGADGRGAEFADSGCCVRVYALTYRIVSVHGTLTRATARFRVTSFTHYPGGPRLRVGQVGRLVLRNGIVTNGLTETYFCSDPAWSATGACGA
jgi:hypothetical protein